MSDLPDFSTLPPVATGPTVAAAPGAASLPDPWREEFAALCILLSDEPCPVRLTIPAGSLRLHLSFSRISIYHDFIQWDGKGEDDCPQSGTDAAILLFLSVHHEDTWNASWDGMPPLRRDVDRFRACIDAWSDSVFTSLSAPERLRILSTARALWLHHCGNRPVPVAQKKTAPPTLKRCGRKKKRNTSGA